MAKTVSLRGPRSHRVLENAIVEFHISRYDCADLEIFHHTLARSHTIGLALSLWHRQKTVHCIRQGPGIAWRHDESGVPDNESRIADIARDTGNRRGHGLANDIGEGFSGDGWQHQRIDCRQQPRDIFAYSEKRDGRLQLAFIYPACERGIAVVYILPGHQIMNLRSSLAKCCRRIDQQTVPLLYVEAADHRNDRDIVGNAELPCDTLTHFRRGFEAGKVESVRQDFHLVVDVTEMDVDQPGDVGAAQYTVRHMTRQRSASTRDHDGSQSVMPHGKIAVTDRPHERGNSRPSRREATEEIGMIHPSLHDVRLRLFATASRSCGFSAWDSRMRFGAQAAQFARGERDDQGRQDAPEDWKSKLAKNRQKDKDARWTRKHERSYFCNQAVPVGYKNHIGVDRRHKFVRRYVVSDASVHDSQKFEDVLDTSNTASDVWADSAYRSQEIEEKLDRRGLKSRIHRRAYRNRKLSEAQKAANATRSKVRARVEHVFGDQKNALGAEIVRTIGIVRARCKIGMTNLVYTMRRFIILERMAEVAR